MLCQAADYWADLCAQQAPRSCRDSLHFPIFWQTSSPPSLWHRQERSSVMWILKREDINWISKAQAAGFCSQSNCSYQWERRGGTLQSYERQTQNRLSSWKINSADYCTPVRRLPNFSPRINSYLENDTLKQTQWASHERWNPSR